MTLSETRRQKLLRLRETCRGARSALALIYGNPDPDALASAMALVRILKTRRLRITIGYTGAIGRPENAAMIRRLGIPAIPVNEKDAARFDVVALVDCQPRFFRDFALPRCDIVIDHHPLVRAPAVPFWDIRPEYLATSSILTEYLDAAGIPLSRNLASALYYGIKSDSRHMMGDMSPGDLEAVRLLKEKADPYVVNQIEFSQFTKESLDYFSIALVRRRFVQGVMFCHMGPVPFADICVQVADFLIRVEHVTWALVCGVVEQTLVIVFRNDGIRKDAGQLARTTFDRLGSAGGHRSMGRAEIHQSALPGGLLLTDNRGVERFVLGSLAKRDAAFLPISQAIRRIEHFRLT